MPQIHLGDISITVPDAKRPDRKPDDEIVVRHASGAERKLPARDCTATAIVGAICDIVLDAAGTEK